MNTAKIKYLGELRTQCTHIKSNQKIITDAPTDNHGKGEAFSPTDLFCTSLVSCMLTVMGLKAQKNNISFPNATAEMEKIMTDDPRRVSEMLVVIKIPNENYTAEQKQILEDAAINCPVAKSISPEIKLEVKFEY